MLLPYFIKTLSESINNKKKYTLFLCKGVTFPKSKGTELRGHFQIQYLAIMYVTYPT